VVCGLLERRGVNAQTDEAARNGGLICLSPVSGVCLSIDRYVSLPNKNWLFAGSTPLNYMNEGIQLAIQKACQLVDARMVGIHRHNGGRQSAGDFRDERDHPVGIDPGERLVPVSLE
jgi:hypothetical protein